MVSERCGHGGRGRKWGGGGGGGGQGTIIKFTPGGEKGFDWLHAHRVISHYSTSRLAYNLINFVLNGILKKRFFITLISSLTLYIGNV